MDKQVIKTIITERHREVRERQLVERPNSQGDRPYVRLG